MQIERNRACSFCRDAANFLQKYIFFSIQLNFFSFFALLVVEAENFILSGCKAKVKIHININL